MSLTKKEVEEGFWWIFIAYFLPPIKTKNRKRFRLADTFTACWFSAAEMKKEENVLYKADADDVSSFFTLRQI